MTKRYWIPLAVALVAAGSLVWLLTARSSGPSWNEAPGSLDALGPSALWVRPADGLHDRHLMTPDELRSKYPFQVELPSVMPPGYHLLTVTLTEAGHPANPAPPSWLSAQYALLDGGPDIRVNQAAGEQFLSLDGAEEKRVGDTPAVYLKRNVQGIRFDWLYWTRCGRTFSVQSNGGVFSPDELVRIAESMGPKDCYSD